MERRLFILLSFSEIMPLVLPVHHKYHLIQEGKTWSDAQAYCRATYSDLATIESQTDMVQIQKEAQVQGFNSIAWIGLHVNITSWRWSLRNEPLGNLLYWGPDNYHGKQECGAIIPDGWDDAGCAHNAPFVCFDARISGKDSYIYYNMSKSWYEAQSFCRQFHTDLASVRNETEKQIVKEMIPVNVSYVWSGLFRDSWKWSDQTNISSVILTSLQLDNAGQTESCGYLHNTEISDALCSDIKSFFCHTVLYPVVKQIIKVKVRSAQNVNDPAIKMKILNQIKQKLIEHGVAENVTVKYREQPDEKVFHKIK